MIYKNDSTDALYAMERDRTGNYGEDDYIEDVTEEDYPCDVCDDSEICMIWSTPYECPKFKGREIT